jgi:Sec-independent protein translocase protein TatA
VPRKGRARRFREARELKQGFDDDLFKEDNNSTLADVWDPTAKSTDVVDEDDEYDDDEDEDDEEYDPLDH